VSLIRFRSRIPLTNSPMNLRYLYILSPAVTSINIFSLKKGQSTLAATYDFGAAVKDIKFNGTNLVGTALYVV
jgi:hypothetical protein